MTPASRNNRRFKRRQTPRPGKKTSVVWHFFKSLPMENGVSRASCSLCKVVFRNPGGSTTGMRGHLDRKHPGMVERVLNKPVQNGHASNESVNRNPQRVPPVSIGGVMVRARSAREQANAHQSTMIEHVNDMEDINLPSTSQAASTSVQSVVDMSLAIPYHGEGDTETEPTVQEEIIKSLVHMLTSNLFPMDILSKSSFLKLVGNLNPAFISNATDHPDELKFHVLSMLDAYYEEGKQNIRVALQDQQISIQVESWFKQYNETHFFISCSYICPNWTLESAFLGVKIVADLSGRTMETQLFDKIGSVLLEIFDEYGIDRDNVVSIMYNAFPYTPKAKEGILSIPTLICFNQVVRESYEELNVILKEQFKNDPMEISLRAGEHNIPNFLKIKQHPGKLCQGLETYIQTTGETFGTPPLSVENMEAVGIMQSPINSYVEILMDEPMVHGSTLLPLISAMKTLYKEVIKHTTSMLTNQCKKTIMDSVSSFYQKSYKMDFNRSRIGDLTLAICAFLDPRYKSLIFLSQDQRQCIHDKIMDLLTDISQAAESNEQPSGSHRSEDSNVHSATMTDPLNTNQVACVESTNHPGTRLTSLLSEIMTRRNVANVDSRILEEFKKYLEASSPLMNVNPCAWWPSNEDVFPNLSKLAKKYLCIQGVAISGNSMFTNVSESLRLKMREIEPEYLPKMYFLHQYPAALGYSHDDDVNNLQTMPENSAHEEPVFVKREPVSDGEEDVHVDCNVGGH